MKPRELRDLTNEELNHKLNELQKQLYELRCEIKLGRLEKPHQINLIKKDIARINTIIKERTMK
jgi:large subunit ribosomal protein L29